VNKVASLSVNSCFIHKLGDMFSSRIIVALFLTDCNCYPYGNYDVVLGTYKKEQ
jgi:hypothetical protein